MYNVYFLLFPAFAASFCFCLYSSICLCCSCLKNCSSWAACLFPMEPPASLTEPRCKLIGILISEIDYFPKSVIN